MLKKLIKNALDLIGEDPENFYEKDFFDSKTERARKKNRGIIEDVPLEESAQLAKKGIIEDGESAALNTKEIAENEESASQTNKRIIEDNDNLEESHPLSANGIIENEESAPRISNTALDVNHGNLEESPPLSTTETVEDNVNLDDSLPVTTNKDMKKQMCRSDTLERLLKVPSESTQQREREHQERINEFEKEVHLVEIEMDNIEKRRNAAEERRQQKEIEVIKLQHLSDNLRQNLKERDIKKIFSANLRYFKSIKLGLQNSWRHTKYLSPKNKAANINHLRFKMIGPPFSEIQQDQIYAEVKKVWLNTKETQKQNDEYVELVLLPEVFLTIYQKYFILPNTAIAEKRIGNVLGSLYPDDISPDTSQIV